MKTPVGIWPSKTDTQQEWNYNSRNTYSGIDEITQEKYANSQEIKEQPWNPEQKTQCIKDGRGGTCTAGREGEGVGI